MSCCRQGSKPHEEPDSVSRAAEKAATSSGCCSAKETSKAPVSSGCCSSHHATEEAGCCGDEHKYGGCCDDEPAYGGCCGGDQTYEEEAPDHIHAEMTIQELLSNFPAHSQRLAQELTQMGLQCVGCQAAVYETIESGMKRHGKDDAAIERLLSTLNAILEEHSDPDSITLTPRAAKKYLAILEADGKEGWGLRFGDKPAGCSGFEYELDYSEKANPEDVVFLSEGIEIHVHPGALNRLVGSLIDYVDGLHASGFKISNPKARSSCGCGSSHNY